MTGRAGVGPVVDRLFRAQSSRLTAYFVGRFGSRHVGLAEEVVQEALVKALQQWPYTGVPANPAGWLFRVAANAALDAVRRHRAFRDREDEIARTIARDRDAVPHRDPIGIADDELRMVLMCCHPALPREARVALSLKTVGGLGVHEIARALLSDPRAVAQRLVRAKRQLRALDVPFEVPAGRALAPRVRAALDVIYLMFNEGHSAHDGENLTRADLCREALRLGRLVADAPATATPEADALVALMAFQAARIPARTDEAGRLVRLDDQDRTKWDADLIAMGFEYLVRSMAGRRETSLHLQAAIAATHAAAPHARATDWPTILQLYDALVAIDPSPVARLNRAVAVARVHGPAAGLAAVEPLARERAFARYHLLPAMRAEWLSALGRPADARRAYAAALARPCSGPERRFLEHQRDALARRSA